MNHSLTKVDENAAVGSSPFSIPHSAFSKEANMESKMTLNDEEVTNVVQELVDRLKESETFYRTASHHAAMTNDTLREFLQVRARQRSDFIAELESKAWETSDSVIEEAEDGLLPSLQRGLMTVKAAMTIEKSERDEIVLAECDEAEERLLQNYQEALSEELPPGLRRQVQNQYSQLQASHVYAGTTRERAENPVVIGLFSSMPDLEKVWRYLETAGFHHDQIRLIIHEDTAQKALQTDTAETTAKEGAGAAALGGGIVGGLIGLVAGATIPLSMPFITVGGIAAALGVTVAGAGIGATYGGIFGALMGWGVGEDDTHVYIEGIRRGDMLLAVRTKPERVAETADLLRRANGRAITTRHETFEEVFPKRSTVRDEKRDENQPQT